MLLLNASDGGNCGAGNTPFAPCFEHLSKRLTVVTSFLFKQAAKLYTDKSLTKQALDEWKMSVLSQPSTESLLRTKTRSQIQRTGIYARARVRRSWKLDRNPDVVKAPMPKTPGSCARRTTTEAQDEWTFLRSRRSQSLQEAIFRTLDKGCQSTGMDNGSTPDQIVRMFSLPVRGLNFPRRTKPRYGCSCRVHPSLVLRASITGVAWRLAVHLGRPEISSARINDGSAPHILFRSLGQIIGPAGRGPT